MDIINEFYRKAYDAASEAERMSQYTCVGRMECNDGYHVSVQAGKGKYSQPRCKANAYYKFELGFPSAEDELLRDYCEDPDRPTDTVYGYVPVSVLVELVEKHGGIKGIYVYPKEKKE